MIDIPVGEPIKRKEVHARYGGSGQGGICPSAQTDVVLLFTNPSRGSQHGYDDGWGKGGCYHYSGQGREGDQEWTANNIAVLEHVQQGRQLHLFEYVASSIVRRVGEFVIDSEMPYFTVDAPDGTGTLRRMFIFRLRPVAEALRPSSESRPLVPDPANELIVDYVPLEKHHIEHTMFEPGQAPYQAERREAGLVGGLRDYLEGMGHHVTRNRIIPPGEVSPLYTDLFDQTDNLLVEAKSTTTRDAVRMGVGQLCDYRRHVPDAHHLALLVPHKPRTDLIDLCAALNIAAFWPEKKSYVAQRKDGTIAPIHREGHYRLQ